MSFCAIDFGTSNSAIAIPAAAGQVGMRLVPLEGEHLTNTVRIDAAEPF